MLWFRRSSEFRADFLAANHADPNDLVSIVNTVPAYVRRKGAFFALVKRKGHGSLPKGYESENGFIEI